MEIELLLNPELVQLLPNWDELNAQWESKKYLTVGGPFLQPLFFARALFLHDFRRFLGAKKGHSRISEEKMTKISDFVFLFGSFFYKREKYLLIFVCTFKFSVFNKLNPTENFI